MTKYYGFYVEQIGSAMDKKSRIVVPDFGISMDFTDSGEYLSGTIEYKIARLKIEDTIWCYRNDKRPLPEPTDEETFIETYKHPFMSFALAEETVKPNMNDFGPDPFAFPKR